MAAVTGPTLFQYDEILSYGPGGSDSFRSKLVEMERETVIATLRSENELLLTRQGLTLAGYKFSKTALAQACLQTATGLFDLVMDLSGTKRRIKQDRADFAFDEAIQVFNTLVRRRFKTRLYGSKVIRRGNVIVGFRPNASFRTSTLALFDAVLEHVERHASSLVFLGAKLGGATSSFRFRRKTPYFSIKSPEGWDDVWYDGFCYRNLDCGGNGSTNCFGLLVRDRDLGCALSDHATKVRGRRYCDADPRLMEVMVDAIGNRNEPHPKLMDAKTAMAGIAKLRANNLGMGNDDTKADTSRRDDIIRTLDRYIMARKASVRAFSSCLRFGAYDDIREERDKSSPYSMQRLFATRTAYDMCVAVSREAKTLPTIIQERSERTAYRMIDNRIKI